MDPGTSPRMQSEYPAPDSPSTASMSESNRTRSSDGSTRESSKTSRRSHKERSSREIAARMIVLHERENVKDMERMLRQVTEQYHAEKRRADNAERDFVEVLTRLRTVNDEKLAAIRDAEKAKRELSLYQIQLEKAAFEIKRAQETVNAVDAQRVRAEEEAARARSTARRLNEERLIEVAREEGRRIGILEGLQRGREFSYGRRYISSVPATTTTEDLYDDEESIASRRDYARATREGLNGRRRSSDAESEDAVPTPPQPMEPVPEPPVPEPTPAPPPRPPSTAPSALTGIPGFMSPGPSHVPPPDNFIPMMSEDGGISLPPPHEFHQQQTPQAMAEPPLPPAEGQQTPGPERRRRRHHYSYRQSSPESLSTTLSHLDMVKEPDQNIMSTPMSAIAEVRSAGPSPNPTPGPTEMGPGRSTPAYTPSRPRSAIYRRPSTSSSESSRPPPRRPALSQSATSGTSVPDITIQPPSRSETSQEDGGDVGQEDMLTPTDAEQPPLVVPPPEMETIAAEIDELPPGFVPAGFTPAAKASPLPGSNPMPTPRSMPPHSPRGVPSPMAGGIPTPMSMPQPGQPRIYADGPYGNEGPSYIDGPAYGEAPGYAEGPAVIPPPLDDEAIDSGMESDDGTLTTPPQKARPLNGSRKGTPSVSGSRRGTPSRAPSVASTARRAAGVPLPGSTMTAAGVPLPPSGVTAAGVPLPPSGMTAAGVPLPPTPASTVRTTKSKSRYSSRG